VGIAQILSVWLLLRQYLWAASVVGEGLEALKTDIEADVQEAKVSAAKAMEEAREARSVAEAARALAEDIDGLGIIRAARQLGR
jgi:hypothetical protein